MSVYKQVRKHWLKSLTKDQRKQIKGYIQDIADIMLQGYAETLRLKQKSGTNASCYMPIANTGIDLKITINLYQFMGIVEKET